MKHYHLPPPLSYLFSSQYPSKQVSTSLKMYFTMIDAKENSKSTRALIFPDSRRTIAILAYYFSTFVGNKSSPFSNLPINPMASNTLSFDAFERISSLLPLYESLVTSLQPFPKGDGMTDAEKYRMELVNFCYELWVLILSMEQSDDESMGDRVERHYKLIEV